MQEDIKFKTVDQPEQKPQIIRFKNPRKCQMSKMANL